MHVFALAMAPPAFVVLFAVANGTTARVSVLVYALGLVGMFAVSATYHRWVHTLRARAIWRRADHATIYATIAGTTTPFCLLAIARPWSIVLLVFMWVCCAVGMTIKIAAWRHARIVGGTMYIGMGWVPAAAMPSIWIHAGVASMMLLAAGGVSYTVGAVFLHQKWPRLRPATFGYHEVWHACTVLAAVCHFIGVWLVVTR